MPALPLPERPNLEQLRRQAKDLRRAVRAADPDALAEVAEHHRQGRSADGEPFALSAAQLVVARRYGFASWARLKQHVEMLERYSRFPADEASGDGADPADTFLRLACLSYEGDEPEHWAQATQLLAAHPEISGRSAGAAAAAADVDALTRILDREPDAARRPDGPYRWEPLMYLAYARHDPAIERDAVLAAAGQLLQAGADPDAGFLWHGQLTPFTVLTGIFGEGELGPLRQPRHPHSSALARLVLEAGAEANDAQALYNRMFGGDDDHLELLFEYGLGRGGGGPWRRRLGDALPSPARLLRTQLRWAITHGMAHRVRLLAEHGVDTRRPFADGSSPAVLAVTSGHAELVAELSPPGSPPLELEPAAAFVGAALAADGPRVAELRRGHPDVADEVRAERPGLVVWAAVAGQPGSVELLVAAGFDVNAKGRSDTPANGAWETALHHAAAVGNLELARTLLRLGADPDIRDHRFDAPALGWARQFGQAALVELLEPITAGDAGVE